MCSSFPVLLLAGGNVRDSSGTVSKPKTVHFVWLIPGACTLQRSLKRIGTNLYRACSRTSGASRAVPGGGYATLPPGQNHQNGPQNENQQIAKPFFSSLLALSIGFRSCANFASSNRGGSVSLGSGTGGKLDRRDGRSECFASHYRKAGEAHPQKAMKSSANMV
jgi:hypothetical protein